MTKVGFNAILGDINNIRKECKMEKNYDGYCRIYSTEVDYSESSYDQIGVDLKVANNKIVDCFAEKPEQYEQNGYTFVEENALDEASDISNNMEKIVGEDFKDIIFESAMENKFLGQDPSHYSESECVIRFEYISEDYFMHRKKKAFSTPEEMKAHDQKVADILQAKENKNTLGKTDTLSRLAGMKNEHTGGK